MKIEVHYPENTLEHDLEEYDLHVWHRPKSDPDCEPIDFEIRTQKNETCATVWGSEPFKDVQIDCKHDFVEYGKSDNECGVCPLCGAKCYWHWEQSSDGDTIIKEHVIDGWGIPDRREYETIGGIVGEELKRLQEKW